MKTTVEISDPILSKAKRIAADEGTTVKALIEEGLRRVLEDRRKGGKFRLRKASVGGKGVKPPLTEGDWEALRELAYEGRGS
jgi:hypothetical protein